MQFVLHYIVAEWDSKYTAPLQVMISNMLRSVSELLLLLPFMDPSQLDGCCMLDQQRGGQSAQLPTLDPGVQCFPCLAVSITWLCFPCFQY